MSHLISAHVTSVNICREPRVIGKLRGNEHTSGIVKDPIDGPIVVANTGIEGDRQHDRRVHGGERKAIYVLPYGHLVKWAEILGKPINPGVDFGENLTVMTLHENTACIGDRWRWGDVVFEVTTARRPCMTLETLHSDGTTQVPMRRLMKENGLCGWYLRVVTPGTVEQPIRNRLYLIHRPEGARTVAEQFRNKMQEDSV